jgi:hypothetical protein
MIRVVSASSETVTPTIGQQIFVIGSGIAGGVGGFLLAKELSGMERVPVSAVAAASIISILATIGAAIYLAKKAKEYYGA